MRGRRIKSPIVMTTLHNDHFTLLFCRRLSQLLPLDGNFGLSLLPDLAARCLTFRQKYLEEVEGRVIDKNGMYF